MRALSAIVVSIVVVITGCARSFAMPSAEELQDPIERYLVNQQACSGTVKVERLRIDRVGDYDRELGGWPVYAVFEVSCRQSGYTETWTGGDSDEVIKLDLFGQRLFDLPRNGPHIRSIRLGQLLSRHVRAGRG